jgi:hypothetical protein
MLAQHSIEMTLVPAHVRDMARVRTQDAVTAPGSLAEVRRPSVTGAMRSGGTDGYSTMTTSGGHLTRSRGRGSPEGMVDSEVVEAARQRCPSMAVVLR